MVQCPKGKATQRCLPRAKANSLTKAQRASTLEKKLEAVKGKQFVKNTKKAKVKLNKEGTFTQDWWLDIITEKNSLMKVGPQVIWPTPPI